ncbi:TPA: hypothetical protein ACH3X1_000713 [Trebouxia sp. C0004]
MANNGAPAVPEVNDMLEEHGTDRAQWDRPGQEAHVTPVRTARNASGERESENYKGGLKERELIGTPYHPGGSAIIDFIKKLTPAVHKYVQDNAPEQWWTDVKHVYKTSLQYELNQLAAVTVHTDSDCEPDVGLDISSESDVYLLEHDIEHGGRKRVRTPPSVRDARKKSQTCYRCGEPGHRAKDCYAEF